MGACRARVLKVGLQVGFGGHPFDVDTLVRAFSVGGYKAFVATGVEPWLLEREVKLVDESVVVFFDSDFSGPLNLPSDTPIFRTSLLATAAQPNEFVLPVSWVRMPRLEPLAKGLRPRICFCGNSLSHSTRKEAIAALRRSSVIECHFELHTSYWAGNEGDEELHERFERNMAAAEFVLCPRGAGNFSIRFYETLKAGRVPVVLVDADTSWPVSNLVDWKQVSVWAESTDVLATRIHEFWSSRDMVSVQEAASAVFERYFSATHVSDVLFSEMRARQARRRENIREEAGVKS